MFVPFPVVSMQGGQVVCSPLRWLFSCCRGKVFHVRLQGPTQRSGSGGKSCCKFHPRSTPPPPWDAPTSWKGCVASTPCTHHSLACGASVGQGLPWHRPSARGNSFPLVLEALRGSLRDRDPGGALVLPALSLIRLARKSGAHIAYDYMFAAPTKDKEIKDFAMKYKVYHQESGSNTDPGHRFKQNRVEFFWGGWVGGRWFGFCPGSYFQTGK